MKILVDNSVLRDAVIAEWDKQPHSVSWGGHQVTTEVVVMRRRPLPPADQAARRQAIHALPTVARLAREGRITLLTYEELNWERVHGGNPAVGTRGDLFGQVEMSFVETAVSRSFFRQSSLDDYWTKKTLTRFCKTLLSLDASAADQATRRRDLPNMSVQSLKELSRFKKLCKDASDGHLTDLFHIWTGERNECSHFLTMERRICNWVRSAHKSDIRCAPIRPEELLAMLGITELDPMPFQDGSVLDYFSAVDTQDP